MSTNNDNLERLPSLSALTLNTPTLSGINGNNNRNDMPSLSLTGPITASGGTTTADYRSNDDVLTSTTVTPLMAPQSLPQQQPCNNLSSSSVAPDCSNNNGVLLKEEPVESHAMPFLSLSSEAPKQAPVQHYHHTNNSIAAPPLPPIISHHPYQQYYALRENYESVVRTLETTSSVPDHTPSNNNNHSHGVGVVCTCGASNPNNNNNNAVVEPSPSLTSTAPPSSSSTPEISPRNAVASNISNPFPRKLFEMLEAEDSEIVCWLPSGQAFIVKNSEIFIDKILPKYFRHTKLTSFQRQLNLYGFRRITKGPEAGAYRHDLFRHDDPDLCLTMRRSKQNSSGGITKSPNIGPLSSPSIRGRRRSGSIESYGSATSSVQNTPDLAPSSGGSEPTGLSLLPSAASSNLPRKSSFKNLSSFSMQTIAEGSSSQQQQQQHNSASTGLSVLINQNNRLRLDNPERQASALAAAGMVAEAVQKSCDRNAHKFATVTQTATSPSYIEQQQQFMTASPNNKISSDYSSTYVTSNISPTRMSYPLQQLSPNGGGGWTSMPLPTEMISNFDDIDMELDFYNMFSSENEVQMFQFLPPDDNNNSNSELKPSSS